MHMFPAPLCGLYPAARGYAGYNATLAICRHVNPHSRPEYSARVCSGYTVTTVLIESPITFFVMNGGDLQIIMPVIIKYREETEITHHFWRRELTDKASSLKSRMAKCSFPASRNRQYQRQRHLHPWATRQIRLISRNSKAERIGVGPLYQGLL